MRIRPWLPSLLAAICLLAGTRAEALQVIDARDGVAVEAVIANREPTRIRIDHARITDVFGNIYSSNCGTSASGVGTSTTPAASPAVNPGGEVALECDPDKGEIYVRPVGDATKPINLFVSSANATYTLLLRRSDTPSDTIVIRDRSARGAAKSSSHDGPLGVAANPVRAMKALLVAMASDRVPADIEVEEVQRPVPLWNEARFSLIRVYQGRGLIGEKYLLTNISHKTMVLAEQEFDRAGGGVLGVAIDHLNLRPGESTGVYLIRMENGS